MQSTDLKTCIERVIKRYKTLNELKAILNCSASTLSAWRKGKTQLSLDDAMSMGLLDLEAGANEYERLVYWVKLCGHDSRMGEIDIPSEIEKRTSLAAKIHDALENIKRIARATGKGISDEDFRLAFSCYLGQKCLWDDIKKWKKLSHGCGTMAYIWRWHSNILKRFETDALKDFVQSLIQQPSSDVTRSWMPPTKRSEIGVSIYLQINLKGPALEAAQTELRKSVEAFLDDLALRKEDRTRFKVFTTTKEFRHQADCCVFFSPPPGKTFAVLVSEAGGLVDAMEKSDDPEIKKNPYAWSGQIVNLNDLDHDEVAYKAGLEAIQKDCLAEFSIAINGRELKHNHWIPFAVTV